ncbi:hypothetical protein KDX38_21430 [Pseudomonas sp. CDFA 602]|uniref:hypothetical protein n=1 Tax=Pseudomonas californiensis TaxID=2829823 RepID=UPI001E5A674F|nr:hypothetical protein [Pseudomonas californiensis]MCD5996186.1 hypothetical protein [Pseudomonas californiensis]MCD6001766.1 hypothetical protein [Pseudomonas californiensis]
MTDDPHTLWMRFQTPNSDIASRERAPMLAQEKAWAQERALGHGFNWLFVLMPPLVFGPLLPGLAFLVSLLLYQGLIDHELNIDRVIGASFGWLVLATLLFTAAWALRNYWRDTRDPTKAYWQRMPEQGQVELERHILLSVVSLWASVFDPDVNTIMHWRDGQLRAVQSSGVSQWILALTAAGHWLVFKEEYPGSFTYGRVGRMPPLDRQLQPLRELAVAFAPGTQLSLGLRFEGECVPTTHTAYWMDANELKRLGEVAHHWCFFPPDRYGVINPQDAEWVRCLANKAQASEGSQTES